MHQYLTPQCALIPEAPGGQVGSESRNSRERTPSVGLFQVQLHIQSTNCTFNRTTGNGKTVGPLSSSIESNIKRFIRGKETE